MGDFPDDLFGLGILRGGLEKADVFGRSLGEDSVKKSSEKYF